MSPQLQTIVALAIVAITVGLMLWSAMKKKRTPGCGCGAACSAVSPEIKNLQARIGK